MLDKKEFAVMQCVFNLCKDNNNGTIVSDEHIIDCCPKRFALTNQQVDTILKQLEFDGYFECTKSLKNQKTVNVITLKRKGQAFEREVVQRKREIASTMALRILCASVGAIVALAINWIFS